MAEIGLILQSILHRLSVIFLDSRWLFKTFRFIEIKIFGVEGELSRKMNLSGLNFHTPYIRPPGWRGG